MTLDYQVHIPVSVQILAFKKKGLANFVWLMLVLCNSFVLDVVSPLVILTTFVFEFLNSYVVLKM